MYTTHDFCACCKHPQSDYKHTVFRFPLRPAHVQDKWNSELSDKPYTIERVKFLLESLSERAYMNLLFMKNIEKIEHLWQHKEKSTSNFEFRVEITEQSLRNVQKERKKIKENIIPNKWNAAPLLISTNMDIQTCTEQGTKEMKWIVSHCYDGGSKETELCPLVEGKKVGLLPWTGVATLVDDTNLEGHIFTFLPLPLTPDGSSRTGLPVHVHGHFALDNNRHNVKWTTADERSETTDELIRWNKALVRQTLPKAYKQHLQHLKGLRLPDRIYECFPVMEKTISPWSDILQNVYSEITANKYFISNTHIGISKNLKWLNPSEIFLLSHGEEHRDLIAKVLRQTNQNVVEFPKDVEKTLEEFNARFLKMTLPKLRELLRQSAATATLTRHEKLTLLTCILQDGQYHDLLGIPLLPLADGTFTKFAGSNNSHVYFGTDGWDVSSLLPGTQSRFADEHSLTSQQWQAICNSGE